MMVLIVLTCITVYYVYYDRCVIIKITSSLEQGAMGATAVATTTETTTVTAKVKFSWNILVGEVRKDQG